MKRLLHHLGPILGACLFAAALLLLRHELQNYHYHDVVAELRSIPPASLLLALGLTVFDYLVLTAYDALALRYIRHRLTYRKLALASFLGYAFSHNATILGGSAARYRIYSSLGVSAGEVARLVVFCSVTFWLGFFSVSGTVFVLALQNIPHVFHLPFVSVRLLGVVFLSIVGLYLVVVMVRKTSLHIHGWEFPLPSAGLSVGQIAISSLDWLLAAGVLYVLMPPGAPLALPTFLTAFMLAQVAGLLTYVPGGLGVFETAIVILLGDVVPTSGLIGSLLLYRLVYYLLPLGAAAMLLASHELALRQARLRQFALTFGRWGSVMAPQVLAFGTYVAGAILLLSGGLPAARERLVLIRDLLPLSAIEISHFLASLTGAALLLLARGLQRRLDVSYYLAVILLGAGIALALLRGLDYEEASIMGVVLLALLPCRRQFYRKAALVTHRFTAGWTALIVLTLLCVLWLGMFSYKHVEYSHELWWRFEIDGNAPRFLRATAGAVILVLLYAVARLLMPAQPRLAIPSGTLMQTIEAIVRNSPKTSAHLALLGDKEFVLSRDQNAFIMYGIEGRSWIALGDPVGPEDQWRDLLWQFVELSDTYGGRPAFYGVEASYLHLYTELGMTFLKVGEEGRVDLRAFSLEGSAHKGLRHSHNKAIKEHCSFSILPTDAVPGVLDVLKEISDAWLAEKHTSEKRFSLGFFDPPYLRRNPIAVVSVDQQIVAFANLLPGAQKQELTIDLMRYLPGSPEGIMDYLFVELFLWGHQEGYEWFSLGMAPLSGLESRALAPFWSKAGALIFRHGEHFYNFQGLRQYKEKFDPQWSPRYLACRGALALPRVLANMAALTSGGVRKVVTK